MVWSLDQDDFSNSCGDGSYPLMNVLRSRLSAIPLTSTQFFTTQTVSTIVPQSTTLGQSDVPDTSIVPSTNSQPITTHTTKRITTKITMSSQSSTIQSASPIAPQSTTLGQLGVSDTNSVSFTNGQPVTKQTTKQTTASSILTSSRTILCGGTIQYLFLIQIRCVYTDNSYTVIVYGNLSFFSAPVVCWRSTVRRQLRS